MSYSVYLVKNRAGIFLDFEHPTLKGGYDADAEVLVNLEVLRPEATDYADALYPVAAEQFTIQERQKTLPAVQVADTELKLISATQGTSRIVKNANFLIQFSKDGIIEKWQMKGIDVVKANGGPDYENYRWIENDAPYGGDPAYSADNGINSRSAQLKMATDRKSATMTVRATGRNCSYLFTYTIYANGIVDLKADYTANISNLRRIGMQMLMPGELSNVKYYARGPWANYIDRHTGSFLGEYTTTVADMNEYYLRPQTMGNRQDLRSLEMTNPETGNGIRVDAEGEVAFSTLYWSDVQLKAKSHNWELSVPQRPADRTIYAHFDYRQLGLGNGSCGPGTTDAYKLPSSGTYSYKLRFSPVSAVPSSIAGVNTTDNLRIRTTATAVTVEGPLEAGTSLVVYDLGGSALLRHAVSGNAQSVTLQIADLPHGAYLLQVATPNGQRTHKFVK